MTTDRDNRFRELMAEREAAYAEYRAELPPATTLGVEPVVARRVDWEAWERVKTRYDAAREAVERFQQGEGEPGGR